jgi:serine/threonine protein kinase
MEWLPLGNLPEVLFSGKILMDWALLFRFALDIVSGLIYLHQMGIIHRDIKPENIMLDIGVAVNDNQALHQVQRCKIIDFGIARTGASENATKVGTAGYMAPEFFAMKNLTFSADVFAFGLVFLSMITCEDPWGTDLSQDEQQLHIFRNLMPKIPPWVPEPLQQIITSCWLPNPSDRPSFEQIAISLKNCRSTIIEETPSLFLLAKNQVEGDELYSFTTVVSLLGTLKLSYIFSHHTQQLGVSLAVNGNFVCNKPFLLISPPSEEMASVLAPPKFSLFDGVTLVLEEDGSCTYNVELKRADILKILSLGTQTNAMYEFFSQGPQDYAQMYLSIRHLEYLLSSVSPPGRVK